MTSAAMHTAARMWKGEPHRYQTTHVGTSNDNAAAYPSAVLFQPGEEFREKADIPAQMIRLCVGAEDPGDIIEDLDQALNSL